jgi:hypothetical protein
MIRSEQVITATEPWEGAAVYAYNTMLKVNDTTFFMYYDVVAQNVPILRFTALAISHDGIHFTKPNLGASWFNGSLANNIVWPRSDGRAGHPAYKYHEPGSTFIDTKPGTPAGERFKMVASWAGGHGISVLFSQKIDRKPVICHPWAGGVWLMSSPDGIHFTEMFGKPVVRTVTLLNLTLLNTI